MARLELDIDSSAQPERLIAALIDFTPRRPDLWPGLNRAEYRVFEVGDTSAEIREGNGGAVWAREHYDWSVPGNVTWTVVESGFATPGDFVSVDVAPRPGGGSRVHVVWQRHGATLFGRFIVFLSTLFGGALVRRSIKSGLGRVEEQAADSKEGSPR
jgi:hypothetical protein